VPGPPSQTRDEHFFDPPLDAVATAHHTPLAGPGRRRL